MKARNDLKKYANQLEKLNREERDIFFRQATYDLAARFLRKVIKRTPVGKRHRIDLGDKPRFVKVTGTKGKERVFLTKEGAQAAAVDKYWNGYIGGTLRRGWTPLRQISVRYDGREYRVVVTNNVHYASYVEYGHRQSPGRFVPAIGKRLKKQWVKGRFMMRISAEEIQEQSPAILLRRLNDFLERARYNE